MPNHILNKIEFLGEKDKIEELISRFSTIYPEKKRETHDEKEIIYITEEGKIGYLSKETNKFRIQKNLDVEMDKIPKEFKIDIEPEWTRFPDFNKVIEMPKEIEKSFNAPGINPPWYNWSIENWGTKWNSYSNKKISENTFTFETAWAGVPLILEKMSLESPEIEINYEWSDEDTGYNCSILKLKNGIVDHLELVGGSRDAYELAFSLRPEYKEFYRLVDGNYECCEEEEEESENE